MYIQITTRCNMSCAHCCYNCTKIGEDMTLDTFRKALELCEEYCQSPFLGGGEPTLHKDFTTILVEAIAICDMEETRVGIITNGSITKTALLLAKLAKAGVIYAQVSLDDYHDEIDYAVVEAFQSLGKHSWGDFANIRNTTARNEPSPHGRGAALMGYDEDNPPELDSFSCMCDDWLVQPNGQIRQCGCLDSPIVGNVDDGIVSSHNGCFRDSEFVEMCEENELEYLLDG